MITKQNQVSSIFKQTSKKNILEISLLKAMDLSDGKIEC